MKRRYISPRTYVTWKMNSHLLIYTQFRFFNLPADCLLLEAWGLSLLSTTVGGEVEKPIRRNQSPLFVKTSAFSLDSQDSG